MIRTVFEMASLLRIYNQLPVFEILILSVIMDLNKKTQQQL